jgi:hypothetical protein
MMYIIYNTIERTYHLESEVTSEEGSRTRTLRTSFSMKAMIEEIQVLRRNHVDPFCHFDDQDVKQMIRGLKTVSRCTHSTAAVYVNVDAYRCADSFRVVPVFRSYANPGVWMVSLMSHGQLSVA